MPHLALIRSIYTPYGGVERVALGLAQGLLQKGVSVTLLTLPGQPWPLTDPNLRVAVMGIRRTHRPAVALFRAQHPSPDPGLVLQSRRHMLFTGTRL